MISLLNKALVEKLPFVIYRKPKEIDRYGWFQKDNHLNEVTELTSSCFVFAPFASEDKIVFYPKECTIIKESNDFEVRYNTKENLDQEAHSSKDFHIQLVSKGIDAIKSGVIEKVVLSRTEEVVLNEKEYENYFLRFLKKYPTAFVYWFYHPNVGMWMGATPEQLVKITDRSVKTVALAGTMKATDKNEDTIIWGEKEVQEQQIVTDFIVDALQPFTKFIKKSKPYTFKAGSLVHIKTDIEAELLNENDGYRMLKALHPTPALCGYPKEAARAFILKNEGYNREYYGGYLGEWKFNNLDCSNQTDLFVNLRCMKVDKSKGYLFLGGGINKDSEPESEYYETVNKSATVKSIL